MASDASTAIAPNGTDALLQSLIRGARGRALRVQLAASYPDCSRGLLHRPGEDEMVRAYAGRAGPALSGPLMGWTPLADYARVEPKGRSTYDGGRLGRLK
jgi:hypothetical protein